MEWGLGFWLRFGLGFGLRLGLGLGLGLGWKAPGTVGLPSPDRIQIVDSESRTASAPRFFPPQLICMLDPAIVSP